LCVRLLKEVCAVNKHCLHFVDEVIDVRGEYTQIQPELDGLVGKFIASTVSAHNAAMVRIFPCMTFPRLRGVERDVSDHAMRHEGAIMRRVVDAIECRQSCRKPESVAPSPQSRLCPEWHLLAGARLPTVRAERGPRSGRSRSAARRGQAITGMSFDFLAPQSRGHPWPLPACGLRSTPRACPGLDPGTSGRQVSAIRLGPLFFLHCDRRARQSPSITWRPLALSPLSRPSAHVAEVVAKNGTFSTCRVPASVLRDLPPD
jgi:hypothetical protein